jgi:hypothetical protein
MIENKIVFMRGDSSVSFSYVKVIIGRRMWR